MISRELSLSNALLQDIGVSAFVCSRAYGAESPRIIARQVRPHEWQPVDAEIKVTDPAQLARTLGGKNLYGQGVYAPIRELLQNAVDAVRARRKLESRPKDWGRIRLILETVKSPGLDEVWLHVDDAGVGMSERVLVGPLLDFGRSFWNSSLLQDEFPGLESRGIKPIGKYGIGFFSIFMLGERVNVISRPYTAGFEGTRVLEFASLSSRPILRNALEDELPTDFTTRVSVRISNPDTVEDTSRIHLLYRYRHRPPRTIHGVLRERIKELVSAVDVKIEIEDRISRATFVHEPDWINCPSKEFLDETLSDTPEDIRKVMVEAHHHLLETVESASGECVGRAALWMFSNDGLESIDCPTTNVSVGGFVYPGLSSFNYLGVLAGETEDVKRGTASQQVPAKTIAAWASKQARLIRRNKFQIQELIKACHTIISLEGNPHTLPFCFCGGEFRSLSEFEALASTKSSFHLPLTKTYEDNLQFLRISELGTLVFAHTPIPDLIAVQKSRARDLLSRDLARSIVEDDEDGQVTLDDLEEDAITAEGNLLISQLKRIWGAMPNIAICEANVFADELYQQPRPRWVMSLTKP
jgi:hypothetical protein